MANRNTPLDNEWRTRRSALRPFKPSPLPIGPDGVIDQITAMDWHTRALRSMAQANHWSSEWERIKAKIEATPEFEQATEDVRRRLIEKSYDLNDAMSKYKWHRDEAMRLYTGLMGEAAMHYMTRGE